jgi:hypothetical protein
MEDCIVDNSFYTIDDDGWARGTGLRVPVIIKGKKFNGFWGVDIPHFGWQGLEIAEDEDDICGMCGYHDISVVHYMTHPDFKLCFGIAAGCDCAADMSSDGSAADIKAMRRERLRIDKNLMARVRRKEKKQRLAAETPEEKVIRIAMEKEMKLRRANPVNLDAFKKVAEG